MTGFLKSSPWALPALLIMATVWACLAWTFPAFPIDETRYLTVAWEMRQSGQWMLPTLNGEPYSHKPPLLFWLINLVWAVTGPSVGAARIVSLVVALSVVFLTFKLAEKLFPQDPSISRLAPLLLIASPPFLVYGNMIMFDFLLYACVLAGLTGLWQAGQERSRKAWFLFGAAMGLAVLAKGPVILVHLMPPALLAPFLWQTAYTKREWYLRVAASVLMATLIGLCWAVPAALIGGKEFAHMIFWGQSAGRMVNAFDHRRPVWFYLPFIPLFMLPWLFMREFWRGAAKLKYALHESPIRFILSWLVPAFVIFSLISGKQPHYMVPLASGLALFAAWAISRQPVAVPKIPATLFLYLAVFGTFAAAPFLRTLLPPVNDHMLKDGLDHFSGPLYLAGGACALGILLATRRSFEGRCMGMIFGTGLLLCLTTFQAHQYVYRYFDLRPMAAVLTPYKNQDMAFAPKYSGELGFTAKLDKPLEIIGKDDLNSWFAAHPDGIVIVRHEDTEQLHGFETLYTQPYRGDQRMSVLKWGGD